jgi:hypothetical protein
LDTEAWVWGNLAESLFSLGRWDEAGAAGFNSERVGQSAKPRGFRTTLHAHLARARGDLPEAVRQLAAAREHFGTHDTVPQHALPLATLAIGIAAAEGRLLDARAELDEALRPASHRAPSATPGPCCSPPRPRRPTPADCPLAEPGRADVLERLRKAAKTLATNVPVWQAHEHWVRAELLRAEGRDTPDEWSEAVTAFEPLERPYDLARVRHRLAESLLASGGGEEERDRATELLRLARAVADHLGARPLADAVALLAQRARLTLARAPERSAPAPPTPSRRSA